ncbi:hypothetical protein NG799_27765 [Laspinema sp. D1]|uniref:Uncharacterized protein n=1 Tax=Laspinema palackyanum D2a TaxID=2953684 RepID=A0ABT2N310_9CYAN|nr:hypothetical protein [Laspinema sp. D2a]
MATAIEESTKEDKATKKKKETDQRSIRVPDELWGAFKILCGKNNRTITEPLIQFMQRCVDTGELPKNDDAVTEGALDDIIERKVSKAIAELEARLTEQLEGFQGFPTNVDTFVDTPSNGHLEPVDTHVDTSNEHDNDIDKVSTEDTVTVTSSSVTPTNRPEPIEPTPSQETEATEAKPGNEEIAAQCESGEVESGEVKEIAKKPEGAIAPKTKGELCLHLLPRRKKDGTLCKPWQANQIDRELKKGTDSFLKVMAQHDPDGIPWNLCEDGLFYPWG